MKIYKIYIYIVFTLALVLNWVVAGNEPERALFNLNLLPKNFIIIIEFLQILLLIRVLYLYGELPFVRRTIVFCVGFIAFQVLVSFAMGSSFTLLIAGIRYYFSSMPLFLLGFILSIKNYQIVAEVKYLIFLIFLQIPVAVWQFSMLSTISYKGTKFDLVAGTMGEMSTNLMSLVLAIGVLYHLLRYFQSRRFVYLISSLCLIIPSALSEAKGMFLLLFLLICYLVFVFKDTNIKVFRYVVPISVLVVCFIYVYSLLGYEDRRDITNVSFLIEYEMGDRRFKDELSRTSSLVHSFSTIFKDFSPLYGMGIGSSNSNPIGPNGKYFNTNVIRHNADNLLVEIGLLGCITLIGFLCYLVKCSMIVIKANALNEGSFNLFMGRLFIGCILILCFGIFWTDVIFRLQFMYPFALLAGYIVGQYHIIKWRKIVVV